MISTFDNCLFIHIPKAAGQSVESVFLQRAGLNWEQRELFLLKKNSDPKLGPPRLAHLTAQEYLDKGYLTQEQFKSLFKFTIVRNPWDRLVSEYLYKGHTFSFKDFLFKFYPKIGDDDFKGFNGIYRHVMPQSTFILDLEGNLLVDFIGKFENINHDFAEITRIITGSPLQLPHKNKTQKTNPILNKLLSFQNNDKKSKSYTQYYDLESQEFVADLYQQDIKLFNYVFESK
ncbi:sulfotransferase family protein [Pseudoalteromonas tunicata]|jgi:hypothetical protein|uniref:Uncharacterized protein n=1 Tax=Pseudoalteromonas tunicata D2 TaxID=87626 RepID=A4C8I1_9GAMM|nr:sulfotransferase family protein [Pseudoalteromonas tunicata]ATC93400.1 hypothetical protein PTUN_a0634 [Pseudoalteromonas tunicata]AXT32442.1 hypothetical protein D1819_17495 [Pseudoalteromonas tunicata]EAR28896.1 hypothetical protein PTD2_07629 [Pseudoalteromonas tunicata D2]